LKTEISTKKLEKAALAIVFCATAFANTVVVPDAQATAAGNMPIAPAATALRIQQTVGGGQFTAPITIVAIRVRASTGTGKFSFDSALWRITLSTTQAYANTKNGHFLPSATYANNVGPDATVVYDGPVSLSSSGCATPGPCAFDMMLPLSAPFVFDPNNGRLLIDLVSSGAVGSASGSLDGVTFTDPTASNMAFISGDPSQTTGTLALGGLVLGLENQTPCAAPNTVFPCTVAGSMLINSAVGSLFGNGAGSGGGGGNATTTFIDDSLSPGAIINSGSGKVLLQGSGPAQGSYTGTLNVASVSGQPNLAGGRASITCGVTGNGSATLTITAGSSSINLTCPKMAVEGLASTVYSQTSFSPIGSISENVALSLTLPSSSDTVTVVGYSLQSTMTSPGPTIIADGNGVLNAGTLQPGNIVSGSWVAVRGSGFVDPGVSTDWSNSDFSNGLPTTLDNLQVLFNGKPGAMLYVGDPPATGAASQQINVQAPGNLNGPVSVQVVRNNIVSNVVTTNAVTAAPGLFAYTLDGGRSYYPAALLANYPTLTYLGDPAIFPGSQKAKAGDLVSLYANSLAVSPAGIAQVSGSTDPVVVTIGATTIAASFAGLIAPGEYQINFTVPNLGASGTYALTIQIDGQSSQASVMFPYSN
jgi:uncharacterized protein (TIGR03437 family)